MFWEKSAVDWKTHTLHSLPAGIYIYRVIKCNGYKVIKYSKHRVIKYSNYRIIK